MKTLKQIENFINKHSDLNEVIKYSDQDYWKLVHNIEDILSESYFNKNINLNEVYLGEYMFDDLTLGNYFTYLVMLLPFQKNKVEFDVDEFFVDMTDVENLDKYFNKIIQYFTINKNIDVSEDIKQISDEITIFASKNYLINSGVSISLYDMIKLAENNPDIKKSMEFKVGKGKIVDPQKLAEKQDKNLKKMLNAIMNDEDNNFKTYIKSGSGININQFGEVFCYIGYKPDYFGNVIPTPINSSFVRGLNVSEFFINATGARKALSMSKGQVKSSGYLNRKLGLLLSDVRIKNYNEDYDCHSKHPINIFIDSEKTLRRFNNRYIVNDDDDSLRLISENDKDLIGTTVKLRSPITCACKNNYICPICYGRLSRINKNKNIGTISELILTNPLTQKLLSSKHLLKVNMEKINWSEKFLEYFYINENKIIPKQYNFMIYIHKDDLIENEDSNINKYSTQKITIKPNSKERFDIELETPLYLSDEIYKYEGMNKYFDIKYDYYKIPLKKLDELDYIFYIIIENCGIADPLLEVKDLMEKNTFIKSHTIEETFEKFIQLLNKASVDINSCHIEVILREMLFITENGNDKSIFATKEEFPTYKIMNITEGIHLGCNSPSKSLMFEQVQKQLMTDSFNNVFGKNGESSLDLFFEN